jgi:hypothetical protein
MGNADAYSDVVWTSLSFRSKIWNIQGYQFNVYLNDTFKYI